MALKRSDLERALWKIKDRGGIRELSKLLADAINEKAAGSLILLENDSGHILEEDSDNILLELCC